MVQECYDTPALLFANGIFTMMHNQLCERFMPNNLWNNTEKCRINIVKTEDFRHNAVENSVESVHNYVYQLKYHLKFRKVLTTYLAIATQYAVIDKTQNSIYDQKTTTDVRCAK